MPVQIDATVEMRELAALLDYYRNRTLIQAQAIADLTAQIEALRAVQQTPAQEE